MLGGCAKPIASRKVMILVENCLFVGPMMVQVCKQRMYSLILLLKKWLDINESGEDLIALSEYFVFASL